VSNFIGNVENNSENKIRNMKAFIFSFITFMYTIKVLPSAVEEILILTLPQFYVRQLDTNITLPCSTHHAGGTVVTWSKDEQVLSADNVKVLKDERILLEHQPRRGVNISIVNLRGDDSGLYKCTLNFNKKALHVEHKLQVEVAPSIHFLQPLHTIVARRGSQVRLECRASGHPQPVIRWSRQHNQPFPLDPGNQLTRQGEVLKLRNITSVHSGVYICTADNGVGPGVREAVTLDILYPPSVQIENTWIHVGQGESAVLQCQVIANPRPKVVWYKDTMKLIESSRLHIHQVGSSYQLNIMDVETEDWGIYYCGASNQLGEVSGEVTLTGAPAKPEFLFSKFSSHQYSLDIMWEVLSHYPPLLHEAVIWMAEEFNANVTSSNIPKDVTTRQIPSPATLSTYSYSLNGLQPNTMYVITIRTRNMWGWSPYSHVRTFSTLNSSVEKIINTTKDTSELKYEAPDPLLSQPAVSTAVHSGSHITSTLCLLLYWLRCRVES